jgi:hypothetical protein
MYDWSKFESKMTPAVLAAWNNAHDAMQRCEDCYAALPYPPPKWNKKFRAAHDICDKLHDETDEAFQIYENLKNGVKPN